MCRCSVSRLGSFPKHTGTDETNIACFPGSLLSLNIGEGDLAATFVDFIPATVF